MESSITHKLSSLTLNSSLTYRSNTVHCGSNASLPESRYLWAFSWYCQAPPLAPAAGPSVSPGRREHAAPKRGSTVSPGPEALSLAAHWLALLSCAAARGSLPTPALVLMSDLVQLLYYHAPPASNASSITTDRGRAGSPTIQVTISMLHLVCAAYRHVF